MHQFGFLRVAAACPALRVADCTYNAKQIATLMHRAADEGVQVLVFPELALTGYTCGDLFQHDLLVREARTALLRLIEESAGVYRGLAVVGLPCRVEDQLYNCAAVIHGGRLLGLVPKSFLPNYREFYEQRWFTPAPNCRVKAIDLDGTSVPFDVETLFAATADSNLVIGVEICEDLWAPIPPSSHQALAGATVLLNLSASNEVIGKGDYRRQLVRQQSARCIAGYVYASCGVNESTTDVVFGGHCLIAENGVLLAESRRFQRESHLTVADLDLQRLRADRVRSNTFATTESQRKFERISFDGSAPPPQSLRRVIDAHPFVPQGTGELRERCEEIFQTQIAGLAGRLQHVQPPRLAIGISGGLDSTLALLVTCRALDALGWPRSRVEARTLPGFGTSKRTLDNARALMRHLGVSGQELDIRSLCLDEMRLMGHAPFGVPLADQTVATLTARLALLPADQREDVVFENVQARMRTSLLMNVGFVIGTGDLSECALGWSTYNGDHMSMYNPNVGIPKTLVKFLVDYVARHEFSGPVQTTLLDITNTLISAELLPAGPDGEILQATERTLGPYELHDFFLFHFLRYGAAPDKLLFLASQANFGVQYTSEQIEKTLAIFLRRFFANQFKRSCLPDGPKVGSIALSPRGDWRMPSDAQVAPWLDALEGRDKGAASAPSF